MLGGGYLIGEVDEEGNFTGDEIVYMYPDFKSAIKVCTCAEFQGVLIVSELSRTGNVPERRPSVGKMLPNHWLSKAEWR
jgi:hypothetical protein